MQWSFILNNFGVSPSASNPGDGVSEVILRNKQTNKNPQKTKQHKVSQVQMQYSFSKFFSMQV
jgi:hypothetical protein